MGEMVRGERAKLLLAFARLIVIWRVDERVYFFARQHANVSPRDTLEKKKFVRWWIFSWITTKIQPFHGNSMLLYRTLNIKNVKLLTLRYFYFVTNNIMNIWHLIILYKDTSVKPI